jgi:hypothetical protein
MLGYLGILIPLMALAIPFLAISLSYKQKNQNTKLEEMRLQKEILQLEIEKQNGTLKLLAEENKKYDKIIYSENS